MKKLIELIMQKMKRGELTSSEAVAEIMAIFEAYKEYYNKKTNLNRS